MGEQPETHRGPAAARLLRSAAPPPVELTATPTPNRVLGRSCAINILIACEEGRISQMGHFSGLLVGCYINFAETFLCRRLQITNSEMRVEKPS